MDLYFQSFVNLVTPLICFQLEMAPHMKQTLLKTARINYLLRPYQRLLQHEGHLHLLKHPSILSLTLGGRVQSFFSNFNIGLTSFYSRKPSFILAPHGTNSVHLSHQQTFRNPAMANFISHKPTTHPISAEIHLKELGRGDSTVLCSFFILSWCFRMALRYAKTKINMQPKSKGNN